MVSDNSTAFAVSGLVSSDKKYFPQCSQVQYSLLPLSEQVGALASTFVSLWLAEITVSESSTALAVSGLASSDKKYFLQCSQVQYSLFPFSAQVAAFASTFVSLWLAGMMVSDCSTALAVSRLASSDKKYFPQCSQVQYSLLPLSEQVASFASVFFNVCDAETKSAWSPKSLFFKEDLQLREMVCKLMQLTNALAPMLVTLSGIVMLVKLLQS